MVVKIRRVLFTCACRQYMRGSSKISSRRFCLWKESTEARGTMEFVLVFLSWSMWLSLPLLIVSFVMAKVSNTRKLSCTLARADWYSCIDWHRCKLNLEGLALPLLLEFGDPACISELCNAVVALHKDSVQSYCSCKIELIVRSCICVILSWVWVCIRPKR